MKTITFLLEPGSFGKTRLPTFISVGLTVHGQRNDAADNAGSRIDTMQEVLADAS